MVVAVIGIKGGGGGDDVAGMFKRGNKAKAGSEKQRRHARHQAKSGVGCPLGKVLDLSAGGMRLGCKGKPPIKPGSAATIRIKTPMGVETLNVRCCWLKKTGWFGGQEIGLKFIGISPEQSQRLGLIAEHGYVPEDQLNNPASAPGSAPGSASGSDGANGASGEGVSQMAEVDLVIDAYYQTLEIEPGATADEVRTAYRRLVRQCHPDVCQSDESQQKFLDIQQAYDVLRVHAPKVAAADADAGGTARAA